MLRALGAALALNLSACSAGAPLGASKANPLDAEESAVIYELNRLREGAGIATIVKVCASLNEAASKHSDDMRDRVYTGSTSPDGSTPRSRACAEGFKAACDSSALIGEFIASGSSEGKPTFNQWVNDAMLKEQLVNASFIVAGVGRSLGGNLPTWTLALASTDEPSCTATAP